MASQFERSVEKLASAFLRRADADDSTALVGDIFSAMWGYDQTNVDFYQVVKASPTQVSLREIAKKVSRQTPTTDYVLPIAGKFEGPVLTKKLRVYNGRAMVRLTTYSNAYKWDGQAKGQTGGTGGH